MNISVYGFHDASICLKDNGQYFIYEFERFIRKRYAKITKYRIYINMNVDIKDEDVIAFYEYVKNQHNIKNVDTCFFNDMCQEDLDLLNSVFKVSNFKKFSHHFAHACCAFNQSNFDESYIITYDGDGLDENDEPSSFVFWKGVGNQVTQIKDFRPATTFSLGGPYIFLTKCLSSIKSQGLPNAGKLMGLFAYGKPRDEWKKPLEKYFSGALQCDEWVLSDDLGFDVNVENLLEGKFEYDFAATVQWAFENKFFQLFHSLGIPAGSNICLSGGCALNIVLNQKLFEMGYKVFVPPNTGDCGLTFGVLSNHYGDKRVDVVYQGFDILDKEYVDVNFKKNPVAIKELAQFLYQQKLILGFVEGRSECGPRALGHRSILCYPDQPDLKDKINSKIKFREWYRPFAAIVRLQDVEKYFYNGCESPYMNFCPTLKEKYRFDSIKHIDNTCRVQTITEEQNPTIFALLGEIEKLGGEPILLNTSFNIKGKPILTTLKDAYACLYETELDGFYYNGNVVFNKHVGN